MSRRISLRLAIAALTAASVVPLSTSAHAQDSQSQSVADAARRAREKKKAAEKQPAPVITNDTLKPAAPAAQEANAPGPAPAPTSEAAPAVAPTSAAQPAADTSGAQDANAAPAPAANASDADQKAKASGELADLKQQLAEAQKAAELLLRELALEQDRVYSKPNYASDTAGKAKLDALKLQLADKQQVVDALKSQLAALQASAGSNAPAPPSAPPQP